MNTRKKLTAAAAITTGLLLMGAGCASDADRQSENLSKAAENFEVPRSIIGINGFTDAVMFEVEGRCSIERDGDRLYTICKHGPDDVRRHELGLGDNTSYISTQLEGVDADAYRTRIIIKPENIIPDFDILTGEQ